MGKVSRDGGTRYYDDADLPRLQKIAVLKNLGLSLEEIGQVIDLYFIDGRELEGKRKVLQILKGHLDATERKIKELDTFRTEIMMNIARLEFIITEYEK